MCEDESSGEAVSIKRLNRVEVFMRLEGPSVEAFLDRNGYTVKEIRGLARHAIALWETQKVQ